MVDRLRSRFGATNVCIVADRGMISKETIEALEKEERGWQYILGAHMRSQNEVKEEVLARAGRSLSGLASPSHYEQGPDAVEGQGGAG